MDIFFVLIENFIGIINLLTTFNSIDFSKIVDTLLIIPCKILSNDHRLYFILK